jgi:hypothetical protein
MRMPEPKPNESNEQNAPQEASPNAPQTPEETDPQSNPASQTEGDYTAMSQRLERMEDAINRMSGVVSAIQKAQDSFVANGGTIRETEPPATNDQEGFVPLDKLDFTI